VQVRLSEGRYGNAPEAFKCFAKKIAETCKEHVQAKEEGEQEVNTKEAKEGGKGKPKKGQSQAGHAHGKQRGEEEGTKPKKYNFCAIFITADQVYYNEFKSLHSILATELSMLLFCRCRCWYRFRCFDSRSNSLGKASVDYKVYMNEVPPSHLDRDSKYGFRGVYTFFDLFLSYTFVISPFFCRDCNYIIF
jgi:hypothetical protein